MAILSSLWIAGCLGPAGHGSFWPLWGIPCSCKCYKDLEIWLGEKGHSSSPHILKAHLHVASLHSLLSGFSSRVAGGTQESFSSCLVARRHVWHQHNIISAAFYWLEWVRTQFRFHIEKITTRVWTVGSLLHWGCLWKLAVLYAPAQSLKE